MKRKHLLETTSMSLHLMAMTFMLCDHLWGTIVPGNDWLTCIGRIAFPIFAFLLTEGFFHTKSRKKYAVRLFVFALLSEIPFNLAIGGQVFYPIHQNVLWSFLVSLPLMQWNERARATGKTWYRYLTAALSVLLGSVLGLLTMVDYYHAGILTVLVFYFFHQRTWWNRVGQLLCMGYIHLEVLGGLVYPVQFLGLSFSLPQQGFALLALIPIWLYRGNQGPHSKELRFLYYSFYPLHLLILGLWMVL